MDTRISNPQSKAALLTSAAILLRQAGYTQKAIEILQDAVNEEEEFAPAYTLLGAMYQEVGQDEGAEKAYRQALKIEPDNKEALQGLGLLLRTKERFAEALPYLERHYQKEPTALSTIHGLLDCLEKIPNRKNDILNILQKTWQETKDPDLGIRYGEFLLDQNQTEEAKNILNNVVDLNKTAQTYTKIARIYLDRKEFEIALQNYKLAVEMDENHAPAWGGLAECYQALDQHDNAVEAIEKAISLDPKNYNYWKIKALSLIASKQFEASLQATHNGLEVIRSLPNKEEPIVELSYFRLYTYRVASLIELGKLDQLCSDIQTSLQDMPTDSSYYFLPALMLFNKGLTKEALSVLNLVKDDKLYDDTLLASLRFQTLMQLGEAQQAWEFISPRVGKNITLDAICEIGVRFYQRGLPDPVIEIYRKLHELAPNDIRITNNLGYFLSEKGELDEAESLLLSVTTYPEAGLFGAIAQCNLAYLYNLTGEYEKALQACQDVLSSDFVGEIAYLRVSFWLNGKMHPDPDAVPGREITLGDAARACGAAAALAMNQLDLAQRYVEELIASTHDEDLAQFVESCLQAARGTANPQEVWKRINESKKEDENHEAKFVINIQVQK